MNLHHALGESYPSRERILEYIGNNTISESTYALYN